MNKQDKPIKKLDIKKRTLRPLQTDDLHKIAGGDTLTTPTSQSSDRCSGHHTKV